MIARFSWGATDRHFMTDRVDISPKVDADEYTYRDGTVEQDVRRVRLLVTVQAIFDAVSHDGTPADPYTANELYVDMMRQSSITFQPDVSKSLSVPVVPDLTHSPTLVVIRTGTLLQGRTLKMKSDRWYKPEHSIFDALPDFIPYR